MGGLTPPLEAIVGRLTGGASRYRQPARPAPSRAAAPGSGCDLVTADLDITKILAVPLDRFAREGQILEVRVHWLDVTLWFLPDEGDAEALGREGVGRGRVWTARELIALVTLPDRAPATLQSLALAKLEGDGDLIDVRPREPRGPSGPAGSWRRPGGARGGQT